MVILLWGDASVPLTTELVGCWLTAVVLYQWLDNGDRIAPGEMKSIKGDCIISWSLHTHFMSIAPEQWNATYTDTIPTATGWAITVTCNLTVSYTVYGLIEITSRAHLNMHTESYSFKHGYIFMYKQKCSVCKYPVSLEVHPNHLNYQLDH